MLFVLVGPGCSCWLQANANTGGCAAQPNNPLSIANRGPRLAYTDTSTTTYLAAHANTDGDSNTATTDTNDNSRSRRNPYRSSHRHSNSGPAYGDAYTSTERNGPDPGWRIPHG